MDDIGSIDPTRLPADAPPGRSSRRRARRAGALALAVAVLLAVPACSKKEEASGTPLPEAKLVDLETREPATLDGDGKPMVVNFWASWCTPCRAEMPAFEKVAKELGDQVAIVGVTDETDVDAAKEAAKKAGVTYPLLNDVDQSLLVDLDVSGLPATVFVDEDGKVVGRHLGALTQKELEREIEERYGITS